MDASHAGTWIRRWDAQQEGYLPDREERFAVIGDVVEHAVRAVSDPVVLDLGCGPGSLSGRLARRLPGARIIGLDTDPVLLALGRAHYGARVDLVDADLNEPDWPSRLPAELRGRRSVHAVVSTTALHWLTPDRLAALYRTVGGLMAPGGVLVNGDHLGLGEPDLDELAKLVREALTQRAGVTGREDWTQWWDAAAGDAELAPLVTERSQRTIAHHGSNSLSATEHANLLREAGFRAAGPVWQSGDDHVLVALR